MTEVREAYITDDGQTFQTKRDAEAHQSREAARAAMIEAMEQYANLALKGKLTADGYTFDLMKRGGYHMVVFGADGMPYVGYESFWYGDIVVRQGEVVLLKNEICYRVDSLYVDETNAKRAVLEAMKEKLEGFKLRINALEKSLGAK